MAIVDHPDIDGIIEGLKDRDLIRVAGSMGNVLQNVTETEYPVITQIKEEMIKGGAINAMDERKRSDRILAFQRAKYGKEDGGTDSTVGTCKTDLHDNHHNVRKNRRSDEWKQISEQK